MEKLRKTLNKIDRKGYKTYKGIKGQYRFNGYDLLIDYVQGDPFATPSRIRIRVETGKSGFDPALFSSRPRNIAFCDYLTRAFSKSIAHHYHSVGGSGKSGLLAIDCGYQEVIERTSVTASKEFIEARLEVGLPAAGRRVLAQNAVKIFFDYMPKLVGQSLFTESVDMNALKHHIQLFLNQEHIREEMEKRDIAAFVADGSVLPRESGISSRPLKSGVVEFQSPDSLRVTFDLPTGESVSGMGIKKGITLIIGGGFHGKSTVLNALELGIYNHKAGDGREYVLTAENAVKIRAEDGRRVEKVNISPFIDNLPMKKDTTRFSSENASGSTSQAANIVEAIDAGTNLLLIDEDTCATNFMSRDEIMKQIVKDEKEPITPFIERAKGLYTQHGISTIMIVGSSGHYFNVADTVIMMDEYEPRDVTDEAKRLVEESSVPNSEIALHSGRILMQESFKEGRKGFKVKPRGRDKLSVNKSDIELTYVEQIVEPSQVNTIGMIIDYIHRHYSSNKETIVDVIDRVIDSIKEDGLEVVSKYRNQHPGNLAFVRKHEVLAALNRYRNLMIA